jgi:drug/metabolite transporter (DMT)-like permease
MQESLPDRSTRSTESLLLIVVLIWAANSPLVKFGISGMEIPVFNSIRFLIAGAVLIAIHFTRSRWHHVTRSDWLKLIGLGVIAHVLYQSAYLYGLRNTTVGNSAIILSTSPLWTVFLNSIIYRERVPSQAWSGTSISLLGIILIVIGTGSTVSLGSDALLGGGLSLAASLLWALSTTLQTSFLKTYSATQLSVIMVSVGAVVWTLIAIPSADDFRWGTIAVGYYAAAIGSGTLSTGASNVLWAKGIKNLGPRRTANFNNLVPILAFVFAYFALGEKIYPLQVVGAGITLVGVWLARR